MNPPRKIPIALMGKLKDELNRMEKLSIIEKISYPTDWVNNIVIVGNPMVQLEFVLTQNN